MIPKRQLLLICKRLKGRKELVSSKSIIYNRFTIAETSERWLSTSCISHEKLTSRDEKYASRSYDDDDDNFSFQDKDEMPSYQRNSSRKLNPAKSFDDKFYDPSSDQYREHSGPRNNRWSEDRPYQRNNRWSDERSFPRRRWNDTFNNRHDTHNQSSMSDLYNRIKNKSKTFEEPLPVVKDLYSEHPDVTSRDESDIQNFNHKYEISITGSQKKRPIFNFEEPGFPENIMSALKSMEFDEPSPIQCVAWPHALSGCDMVGIAQTGSGKTLSFILPAMVHVMNRKQSRKLEKPLALVICPTRELAMQVCEVAAGLKRHCGISSIPIYGGQPKNVQIGKLFRQNPEIIVATPGRLMDLVSCDAISLDQVSYVVLDEADRMLDMGFEPQIRSIMDHIQAQRQVLMFSATWPTEVHDIADDYLTDYVHVKIGAMHNTVNPDVEQKFVQCEREQKNEELLSQLQNSGDGGEPVKTLVFCARKITCEIVSRTLQRSGISSQFIHGDCSQQRRDSAMSRFRNGYSKVLVATDVAARGIDVSDIGLVINFDMPTNVDDYIHRVGRTARAGRKGNAVSFITEDDFGVIQPLVKLLQDINHEVPEFLYAYDYQGKRLKSAKNSLKKSLYQRPQHFRRRSFHY